MKTFENIKSAITAKINTEIAEFAAELQPLNVEELKNWRYKDLLTPSVKNKNWPSLQALKDYILARYTKNNLKSLEKQLLHVDTIGAAGDLKEIKISVEWKKSSMWGANPRSTANYGFFTPEGWTDYNTVESGSIGGCGYDKLSTAVAEALNQINPLLKALYEVREANINAKLGELFGYGSGYGLLPRFEGGVGVSCYPDIFKKIGYEFKSVASGKSFDVYQVTKIPVLANEITR